MDRTAVPMVGGGAHETEAELRALCEAGDHAAATARVVQDIGPDILRFLRAKCRNDADADEVFSMFCEDVWRGLPGFRFRCELRIWAYCVARHAARRYANAPHRRHGRNLPLSDANCQAMAVVRSSTAPYQRADVQERLRQLRVRLGEEDQLILILRVDRRLGFRDIAQVLAAPEATLSESELLREASRVRKRFQLVKGKLRVWAEAEGLLDTPGPL